MSRPPVDKYTERRAELADAALQTLSELGYARTSLREIAQNSAYSHGVLHYYFADKVELIACCVRRYKAQCVLRYDEVVAAAKTADALRRGFAGSMAQTLRADARLHRLWYDLRTQSLFESSLRADVAEIDDSRERMVWRIVTAYATLAGAEPKVTPPLAYAMFDGLFQHALTRMLAGDLQAATELVRHIEQAMRSLVLVQPPRAARKPVRGRVLAPA